MTLDIASESARTVDVGQCLVANFRASASLSLAPPSRPTNWLDFFDREVARAGGLTGDLSIALKVALTGLSSSPALSCLLPDTATDGSDMVDSEMTQKTESRDIDSSACCSSCFDTPKR